MMTANEFDKMWEESNLRYLRNIIGVLLVVLALFGYAAYAHHTDPEPQVKNETYYSELIAKKVKGKGEYRLWDGSRVDVVTETHAIEVDWAGKSLKWAEAIGQARYYAKITGKTPGIILLTKSKEPTVTEKANIYKCLSASGCRVWVVPITALEAEGWTLE